jgi:hypothetical protein
MKRGIVQRSRDNFGAVWMIAKLFRNGQQFTQGGFDRVVHRDIAPDWLARFFPLRRASSSLQAVRVIAANRTASIETTRDRSSMAADGCLAMVVIGKPFDPDAATIRAMRQGAVDAWYSLQAYFDHPPKDALYWPDRHYVSLLLPDQKKQFDYVYDDRVDYVGRPAISVGACFGGGSKMIRVMATAVDAV